MSLPFQKPGAQEMAAGCTEDLIVMGQKLGWRPDEWAVILLVTSKLVAARQGFEINVDALPDISDRAASCDCEKCKAAREARGSDHGLH